MSVVQACKNPNSRSTGRIKFDGGAYRLLALSMKLTLLSPFWRIEFRDNPYIFGEFVNPSN